MTKQSDRSERQLLVDAFYGALCFLLARVKNDGWKFSSNYLREHVRCAYHLKFTNSELPGLLREVILQHPEMKDVITLKPLKVRDIGTISGVKPTRVKHN